MRHRHLASAKSICPTTPGANVFCPLATMHLQALRLQAARADTLHTTPTFWNEFCPCVIRVFGALHLPNYIKSRCLC